VNGTRVAESREKPPTGRKRRRGQNDSLKIKSHFVNRRVFALANASSMFASTSSRDRVECIVIFLQIGIYIRTL